MKHLFTAIGLLLFLGVMPFVAHAEEPNYRMMPLPELTQKATAGDAEAQFELGLRHDRGQGVPQDARQAVNWFQKAAEQGHADSQYLLGLFMYSGGVSVRQDVRQAVNWFQKAAEQGHAHAQHNLGYIYHTGRGMPQDIVLAYALYRLAESGGDDRAENSLEFAAEEMTPEQIEEGEALLSQWQPGQPLPTTSKTGRTDSR
ncbi:MAG: sel1 repeat family protein [Betaproteobacteria bacterium]|nr:sel1 repeat family protein [Betaproteobacteria bacterium]